MLEVARVWVPKPDERAPRTAVVTLVAMRSRPKANEPENIPETRRWLEAIRRRLTWPDAARHASRCRRSSLCGVFHSGPA